NPVVRAAFALALVFFTSSVARQPNVAHAEAAQGASPALCGPSDTREPGIQGDVPAGAAANYNCGVRLVCQLPVVGNVQGAGTCAYVRTRDGLVHVIDVRNPARPVETMTVPVHSGSESLRVVTNRERSILVSGSSVYDVKNCLHPVLKGEIA